MGYVGSGGGGGSISSSSDVALGTLANNDVLTYDSSAAKWENKPAQGGSGAVSSVNGKTGVVSLAASDVGAIPTPAAPTDGYALVYDSSSDTWTSQVLTFGAVQGTGTLAQLVSGARFTVLYDPTAHSGAGGWTYAGTYITMRPTARTDIFMDAIDYTGNTAGTGPAFAVAGDSYDVKVS